ncbi:hypothetical protein Tco_0323948 [Tanacetum coccineum]
MTNPSRKMQGSQGRTRHCSLHAYMNCRRGKRYICRASSSIRFLMIIKHQEKIEQFWKKVSNRRRNHDATELKKKDLISVQFGQDFGELAEDPTKQQGHHRRSYKRKKKKAAKNNNLHTMGRRFKDLKFEEGIKNKKIEDTKINRLGGNMVEYKQLYKQRCRRPSSSPLGLFPRPWSLSVDSSDGSQFSNITEHFRLLGRVIAKALQDGRLLD